MVIILYELETVYRTSICLQTDRCGSRSSEAYRTQHTRRLVYMCCCLLLIDRPFPLLLLLSLLLFCHQTRVQETHMSGRHYSLQLSIVLYTRMHYAYSLMDSVNSNHHLLTYYVNNLSVRSEWPIHTVRRYTTLVNNIANFTLRFLVRSTRWHLIRFIIISISTYLCVIQCQQNVSLCFLLCHFYTFLFFFLHPITTNGVISLLCVSNARIAVVWYIQHVCPMPQFVIYFRIYIECL